MFESFQQLSERQRRNQMIRSYLLFEKVQKKDDNIQKYYGTVSQKPEQNVNLETLEAQIKSLNYWQTQNNPEAKIDEIVFCGYNPHRKAQLICCDKYCGKNAIMCGQQKCMCASDHRRCVFTLIQNFIEPIHNKLLQPMPIQIQLYFQVKQVIYDYMTSRISQERQALQDWQQDQIGSEKYLFLYGFNKQQTIVCHDPKVLYQQKISLDHQKCGCIPLKIKLKDQYPDQREAIEKICKDIQKKYSSIINYLDQKNAQLFYHKECASLNSVQFMFVNFLKQKKNVSKTELSNEFFSFNGYLKETKIVPGSSIYLANKYRKKQKKDKDLNFEKFSINNIRKTWKDISENLFRFFVEGKAIYSLFSYLQKAEYLYIHSSKELRTSMCQIIQSLSQGQQQLFGESMLKKNKKFVNQALLNLKDQLEACKSQKFNGVSIYNDRYLTAVNDVEAIKQLGNLKDITKLEIKWCQKMTQQVCIQILKTFPNLKKLSLLSLNQQVTNVFRKKLCQLKQLKLYYISPESHPDYYRSYSQDGWFISLDDLDLDKLPSTAQLLEFSKMPKLQNIQIFQPGDADTAKAINNIQILKHLTLGYRWGNKDCIDGQLMNEVWKQKQLRTLSLVGIRTDSTKIDHIITNNVHLNAIIIRNNNYNENINDATLECMANLVQLQTLCVSKNTKISGNHLRKLGGLIMLEIDCCPRVNKHQVKEALKKMHKLQHLSLKRNNYWLDDQVVMSVAFLKKLSCLDIYDTPVSGEGIKHLKWLTRLNVLKCGCTKINGRNLIDLTNRVHSINKLSIVKLDVSDSELLEISANCQGITHLNIIQTKITTYALLKMKQLKVVRSWLNEDSQDKLRKAGIKTYS